MVPLLLWRPDRPEPGHWRMSAMDVGQGSAILVETANQSLLFDDARMWPDAGNAQPDLPEAMARCEREAQWEADGVVFTFLHPGPSGRSAKPDDRNADSCVLHVAGASHSLLLTGDVGVAQEKEMVSLGLTNVDVVMAPHHGSASSSGRELVQAVEAKHVIAQAGHLNRFRHPARAVALRWTRAGSRFWRSDRDGAVTAESRPERLNVWGQREWAGRYWHGR